MNTPAPQSQVHPIVAFKRDLARLIDGKELALPSNVSMEAFRNAAVVAVQDNADILRCEPSTVMKAIRTIAAAGLVPDGREAAIVPFFTKDGLKAQAMPMVFGLIKMARRSGDVSDIRAHIVYKNEINECRFEYVVGDEERLTHTPILFEEKGEAVAVYAIAKLKDGTIVREFMDRNQIEKVRRSSPQQRKHEAPNGIWQQWADEMWRKTVIRRLCKRLDLSAEDLRRVMVEQDGPEPIKDITPDEPKQNLAARLAAREEGPDDDIPVPEIPVPEIERPVRHWTDDVDTSEAFPGDELFNAGREAFSANVPRQDCPHSDTVMAAQWLGGWDAAKEA